MSQIVTVKTEIRNFAALEKAAKNLGYKIDGSDKTRFTLSGNRASLTVEKTGEAYSFRGDSDYLNRGNSSLITELTNEYNKEEALSWAKFNGRTVLSVKGNASKGYEIEISA